MIWNLIQQNIEDLMGTDDKLILFYNVMVNYEKWKLKGIQHTKKIFNTRSMLHPIFGHKPCWFCTMKDLVDVIFAILKNLYLL